MDKTKVLELCIENRKLMAKNAKDAMDEIQQQANDYGLPRDRYDSFRSQLLRKRDLFAAQYQNVLEEILVIQKINAEEIKGKAEFGSLIITNKQTLFIATGIGKLLVDGKQVFVISPGVPIYKAMEGKKEGEEFAVNGISYTIEQIL